MSRNTLRLEFVESSPSQARGAEPTKAQRRIHSHAAREAHAKVRRQRIIEYRAAKNATTVGPITSTAELATPIVTGPVGILPSGRSDPFGCFARLLTPTENFLLDYYMQDVVPCSKFEDGIHHPRIQALKRQFIDLAVTNSKSLDGLFLVACQHVARRFSPSMPHKQHHFIQLALQYKVACTQALREAISSLDMRSSISDWVVGLVLFLAQDEVLVGDASAIQKHMAGAIQMVRHNSAFQRTNLGAFPYSLVLNDIGGSVN